MKLICQGMWITRTRAIWFFEIGVIGSQRPGDFCLLLIFCWNDFLHKKQINHTLAICYCNSYRIYHPKLTSISPVLIIVEMMKLKNQNKTKIGVGSVVEAKVGDL